MANYLPGQPIHRTQSHFTDTAMSNRAGVLLLPDPRYDAGVRAHALSQRFLALPAEVGMSELERIYQIDQLLSERRFVTRKQLQDRLVVSWATLKRDLAYMKDRLNAPIIFDRELRGYRFDRETKRIGPQYELPGLWFSAEEIHALLTMQHLLSNLDTDGLLGPQIKPLLARLP